MNGAVYFYTIQDDSIDLDAFVENPSGRTASFGTKVTLHGGVTMVGTGRCDKSK